MRIRKAERHETPWATDIDEFSLLRSVAGRSGLEIAPEILRGRGHFRKRDLLFKELRLNPENGHHVALLCSIVYDHLYLSKPSAAAIVYGDNQDFDLLERLMRVKKTLRSQRPSDVYRQFAKTDAIAQREYGNDAGTDRLRMRLNRSAKKAIAGTMKLTKKRQARLDAILPDIKAFFVGRRT